MLYLRLDYNNDLFYYFGNSVWPGNNNLGNKPSLANIQSLFKCFEVSMWRGFYPRIPSSYRAPTI